MRNCFLRGMAILCVPFGFFGSLGFLLFVVLQFLSSQTTPWRSFNAQLVGLR